jgi:Recombination endonuclease VII
MSDELELPDGFSEVPPESGWFGYTSDADLIEKRYRLSPDDYFRMLREQDDLCAICGRHPVSVGPLFVDHDHDHPDKAVRGLLCRACNFGLGHFNDDPGLLEDARRYLLERGSAATREMARITHEIAHPETRDATTGLELHSLDGSISYGAVAATPRLGLDGQTFDKYGREWRVSERRSMPPESGPGAEYLVCYEVGP